MCGIVGILGREPVAGHLLDALKRLEYRGYDSAGVATLEAGRLKRCRAEGKLQNLEARLAREGLKGRIGIAHTRWATHGRPNETNAHPHATDTVVVAHLVSEEMKRGRGPLEAVAAALPRLRGAFALAFLFDGEEDLLVGARKGPPLAVGYGKGEMYLGSDAIALAPFTDAISYLEDGDWAAVRRNGVEIRDASGRAVKRPVLKSAASAFLLDKGNYRHFMAKEIHEQPEVVGHTLAHYLDMSAERVELPEPLPFDFRAIERLSISACGTAYYAGLIAKYWFERFAHLPADVDVGSEFRYRAPLLRAGDLAVFVSQSGETADTLASLRYAREQRQHVLSVLNVPGSTIARESDVVMPTLAGPEIGVASTKAFSCQLATLACLAIAAGRARDVLSPEDEQKLAQALIRVPGHMIEALALEPQIEHLALEGALKLKEISYIHAEGYAAGELKHGPIALIDEDLPVIVIAPHDRVFEKTASNMQEVAARKGKIIVVTDPRGARDIHLDLLSKLTLPAMT